MSIKGRLNLLISQKSFISYTVKRSTRGTSKFKMSMFATATLLLVSVITTESSPLICMYIMSIESDHAYFVIVLITCVFLICHVFVHKI